MKGVILAGGTGTRLRPLTNIFNKHLLPVGKYPMIHYAIAKMAEAGVKELLIVLGKQSAGLYIDYIGNGRQWGIEICYKIQEEAGGIAQALALAESFICPDHKLVVLLGDNLFEDNLKEAVTAFEEQAGGAHVFLKKVSDPKRYGVPVLNGKHITQIVEKPEHPPSDYAVTGIYLYDASVFEHIRKQNPSERGEMEITDVNNAYAEQGQLTWTLLNGWWTDAGTHRSLLEARERLLRSEGE